MISSWLKLPLPAMLAVLVFFFGAIAAFLVLLSFNAQTGGAIRSFRGIVAPFVGTVAVIFGILLGFLANDIWDREGRAAAAVRTEADGLLSLIALAATFDLPRAPLAGAVRSYAETMVTKEWPSMAHGDSAPEAELALDRLLKTIVRLDLSGAGNSDLHRLLLDAGMAVRAARNTRLRLSRDEFERLKWLLVLALAVTSQITVAAVHLHTMRPQIAALTIWTASLIFVIGLFALYAEPFASPYGVAPDPIKHVLTLVSGSEIVPKT